MYSPTIQKLIDLFSKFPTVGPRTAARFVFYLLEKPKEEINFFNSAIAELKNNIKICKFCFKPFEGESSYAKASEDMLCEICSDPRRNKTLLCVVEKETDLETLENTKKYKGFYFILNKSFKLLL